MGRRRKLDTHLPKRMYMRRGAYYFCHPETNEWQPLGKDIAAAFCYQYLDSRAQHPVAARHEISLLGHVLAKAIRWGAATVNPVRTLERTPRSKRTRYVTDAEYAAVHALASERMRIAMELALLTGQRRGDLLT